MELLTEELKAILPPLYSQEGSDDPMIYIKFFTPDSNWTWYCSEGSEEYGTYHFFGFVRGFEDEWGYFLLSELESNVGPWGLHIERDIHFEPTRFSEVKKIERID